MKFSFVSLSSPYSLSFFLSLYQEGNTALHIATKLGNLEVLKALVHQGADPHAVNVVRVIFLVCVGS